MAWKDISPKYRIGLSFVFIQLGFTLISYLLKLSGLPIILNWIGYSLIPSIFSPKIYLISGIVVSSIVYFLIGVLIGWRELERNQP